MTAAPPIPSAVAGALSRLPDHARAGLVDLRALIFDVAREDVAIGPVSESLKWGQPSYAAVSGTPLRLGLAASGEPALLVHCQTSVIAEAQAAFGEDLRCEGTRAVILPLAEPLLRQVVHAGLTYRLRVSSGR